MSTRFVNVDRETPLLLPPNLRDWVAKDDLVHFIVELIQAMDLSDAAVNRRGSGDAQYPPGMMLSVLIYCYCHGVLSSRQIERATYQDVSVRYLSGDLHPDHDTFASFRRKNLPLLHSVFRQVLQLAKRTGVLRIGTVALDGTKIEACANKRHTSTREQVEVEMRQLDLQIKGLLEQAECADQAGAAPSGDHLPQELINAQNRRRKLAAAQAELAAQVADLEAAHAAARTAPDRLKGARVRKPAATDPARQQVNLTDPQSGLTPSVKGFIQGYNAQIVVEADEPCGLILAVDVVRDTSDQQQLEPMLIQTVANLGEVPPTALADSGYENWPQIVRVQERFGLEVLLPPVHSGHAKEEPGGRRTHWAKRRRKLRKEMTERMAQPEVRARYKRRGATVEPVFGTLKTTLRMRRFQGRGLNHVRSEWTLACLAFNCRRLVVRRGREAQ